MKSDIMFFLKYLPLLLSALILQTTVSEFMSIKGIHPDFILIFLVLFAMKTGSLAGVLTGFLIGLCYDVYSPQQLGAQAFTFSLVGFFTGLLDERNITIDERFKLAILFLAALFQGIILNTLAVDFVTTVKSALISRILPCTLYTTFIGGVILFTSAYRKQYGR